jgi:hypothetical protein
VETVKPMKWSPQATPWSAPFRCKLWRIEDNPPHLHLKRQRYSRIPLASRPERISDSSFSNRKGHAAVPSPTPPAAPTPSTPLQCAPTDASCPPVELPLLDHSQQLVGARGGFLVGDDRFSQKQYLMASDWGLAHPKTDIGASIDFLAMNG